MNTICTTNLDEIIDSADIYILAVKDDAIAAIVKKINISNALLVHTSGTTNLDVLKKSTKNFGVFYPLQTFSKSKTIDFLQVPICIEASNKQAENMLMQLAKSISNNVYKVNSIKRKKIHLAAVFACNFTNHLYAIAEGILKKEKLPFQLLIPLIEETANKIKVAKYDILIILIVGRLDLKYI